MSAITKNSCWVIMVTYKNGEVNFNEAYWTYDDCIKAIRKKINYDDLKRIDDFKFYDLEMEITYEAKLVTIL